MPAWAAAAAPSAAPGRLRRRHRSPGAPRAPWPGGRARSGSVPWAPAHSPPTHPTPARETVSRVAGGAAFQGSPARPAWGTRSNFSRAGPRSLGWTVIGAAARPPPLEPRQPTASRPSNRLRSGGSRNLQCNGAQGTSGKSTEVSPSSPSPELFRASEIGH